MEQSTPIGKADSETIQVDATNGHTKVVNSLLIKGIRCR